MTITAALVALVYAVVEAPHAGWADGQTLGLLALAAVLIALFVGIEARSAAPLAPLGVFRSRSLVGGNLVLFALGTMAFGVPFILTQYAQEVLRWSPIHFGLASVVMPVTAVFGSFTAQAIATKGGVRPVAAVGLALTGLGCLVLTHVSVGGSYLGDLFFALLVLGPGIGAAYVAGSIASLTGVAETEAGLASGLNNASFQIGGAVGVAILSTVAVSHADGSFPSSATAASNPSTAKMIAVANADWKPLVSAASGSAPVGLGHGDRREDRDADRAADLERGVVEPRCQPGVRLGHAGQRADRARDIGGPEPGAEDQQPEEDVAEVAAVDRHLGQQQAAEADQGHADRGDRAQAALGRDRLPGDRPEGRRDRHDDRGEPELERRVVRARPGRTG